MAPARHHPSSGTSAIERLPGDNVLLQTFRSFQAVGELMAGAVAGTGVTQDEYAVLSAVAVLRSVSPTELAARLRVPPTTISRHVGRLADAGLVSRAPNPSDRRSYLLELTDDGRAITRRVVPRIRALLAELRERTDVDEIEAALVGLERAARDIVSARRAALDR